MSSMTERRARAARSVDRAFGELVRVLPMRSGGATLGGPDPDAPIYELTGRFMAVGGIQRVQGTGASTGESAEQQGARYAVSFSLEALGTNPVPREGWHIMMLEQDGRPTFRLATSRGAAVPGRLNFNLVPARTFS